MPVQVWTLRPRDGQTLYFSSSYTPDQNILRRILLEISGCVLETPVALLWNAEGLNSPRPFMAFRRTSASACASNPG